LSRKSGIAGNSSWRWRTLRRWLALPGPVWSGFIGIAAAAVLLFLAGDHDEEYRNNAPSPPADATDPQRGTERHLKGGIKPAKVHFSSGYAAPPPPATAAYASVGSVFWVFCGLALAKLGMSAVTL
jgi:hypothetical protein